MCVKKCHKRSDNRSQSGFLAKWGAADLLSQPVCVKSKCCHFLWPVSALCCAVFMARKGQKGQASSSLFLQHLLQIGDYFCTLFWFIPYFTEVGGPGGVVRVAVRCASHHAPKQQQHAAACCLPAPSSLWYPRHVCMIHW
jgi:hypothetical protein